MKKYLFWMLLPVMLAATPTFALRFEKGDNVRISQPVMEDIYVFGGTIYIDAPVHGDIWCAGGTVTVSDTVTGDLVVAGGNVYLRGHTLDDVRAAGGTLTISGSVGGDLLVAGGTIIIEPGAIIAGDMAASGGTLTLNGQVQGNLKANGGTVVLNGAIDKNLEFNGDDLTLNGKVGGTSVLAANHLQIGNNAALYGNVRYWTDAGEVSFKDALKQGATTAFDLALHTHFERPSAKFLGFATFLGVTWYLLAAFVLLWLVQWLFSQTFRNAAATVQSDPIRSMGYGFLYFAAVPVGVVLLLVTVIGIPVAFIALFAYLTLLALANIITAMTAAYLIDRWKGYNWRPIILVLIGLGVLIVLHILTSIPILGMIIHIAAVFIAFGAILSNSRVMRNRPQVPTQASI